MAKDPETTIESLPKISIVTVVYNRVNQIGETILSVIAQKYKNIEYIVIDGGSVDGTVDVIRQYGESISYWISESDNGIYDAMNKAIGRATGEWINFMNCGDRFYDRDVLSFFAGPVTGDVIYGDAMILYSDFSTLWKNKPIKDLWKGPAFCHQACFVRTALTKDRKFDTKKFQLSSDFDFLYNLWRDGRQFVHISRIVCWYDLRTGASLQQRSRSLRERKQVVLSKDKSFTRSFYFTRIILYERIATTSKKLLGNALTRWITGLLRK